MPRQLKQFLRKRKAEMLACGDCECRTLKCRREATCECVNGDTNPEPTPEPTTPTIEFENHEPDATNISIVEMSDWGVTLSWQDNFNYSGEDVNDLEFVRLSWEALWEPVITITPLKWAEYGYMIWIDYTPEEWETFEPWIDLWMYTINYWGEEIWNVMLRMPE